MAYRLDTSISGEKTASEIVRELRKWNVDTRAEGGAVGNYELPRVLKAGTHKVKAGVKFDLRGTWINVECDSQWAYKDNLRCVLFAVQAMRMNEKRGIADTLRKAYLQLEAPKEERDPYEVLAVRPDAPLAVIEASFKALLKERHPDKPSGSDALMKELNAAMERVRAEREGAT